MLLACNYLAFARKTKQVNHQACQNLGFRHKILTDNEKNEAAQKTTPLDFFWLGEYDDRDRKRQKAYDKGDISCEPKGFDHGLCNLAYIRKISYQLWKKKRDKARLFQKLCVIHSDSFREVLNLTYNEFLMRFMYLALFFSFWHIEAWLTSMVQVFLELFLLLDRIRYA